MKAFLKIGFAAFAGILLMSMSVFFGCSGPLNEPYYYESENPDSNTTANSQTAYTGYNYSIEWNEDSLNASSVALSLYQNSSYIMSITSSTTNDGLYTWYVPTSLAVGNNYRIYICNTSNSSDYLYTAYFSVQSTLQADQYEQDNQLSDATFIAANGSEQSHTLTAGDVDWFFFNAKADSAYIIETSGGIDTYLGLYNSYGTLMASDDDAGTGANARIVWQFSTNATYYFKVFQSTSTATGSYQISVTPVSAVSNLKITHPDTGDIITPGSYDTLTWQSTDSNGYVAISLLDSIGNTYSIISETYNDGWYIWNVPTGLDPSIAYRIRMYNTAYSASLCHSGYFHITLNKDSAEPDNSPALAALIKPDSGNIKRTIMVHDTDWFCFDAVTGRTYQIATSGATDMRLTLYSTDSLTVIASNDDGSSSGKNALLIWTCAISGRYFIKAEGFTSATAGAYDFNLATGYTPAISAESPTVPCTTGGSVTIRWTKAGTTGELVRIELLTDTILTMLVASSTQNDGSYYWSVPSMVETGSNYRIKIACVSNPSVFNISPPFTIISVADSFEPDNSPEKADTITQFGITQQRTLTANDSDWIAFSALAGHTYILGVSGISSVYLLLYSAAGVLTANDTKSGTSDDDAKIRWYCTVSGIYYALVRRYSSIKTIEYSFSIYEE